jgi:hypothetical protein
MEDEGDAFLGVLENSPCGHLRLSWWTPIFDVTGRVTSGVPPGTEIRMFVTSNTSLKHSLFVVENCIPFRCSRIRDNADFSISWVPPGRHILYIPIESFPEGTQGFPVPDEFEKDGYALEVIFNGGNSEHSLSVFQIKKQLFKNNAS